jgi:hypothetical protein
MTRRYTRTDFVNAFWKKVWTVCIAGHAIGMAAADGLCSEAK